MVQRSGHLRRNHRELLHLAGAHGMVQRIGSGHRAHQDQHHQPHALLAVVGSVRIAHPAAQQNHQAADVERRRRGSLGGLIQPRVPGQQLEQKKHQPRRDKPHQGRDAQRRNHLLHLFPIQARRSRLPDHHLVRQPHAQDRTDHGMRTGHRQPAVPGRQVPQDRRHQQGKDHREARTVVALQNQLHWQQRDDRPSHRARAQQYAHKVQDSGINHSNMRLQRVGIDHRRHRIRRIVKPVHKLEAQRNQQRQPKQQVWKQMHRMDDRKVAPHLRRDIDQTTRQNQRKYPYADLSGGRLLQIVFEYRGLWQRGGRGHESPNLNCRSIANATLFTLQKCYSSVNDSVVPQPPLAPNAHPDAI